jgi:beta-lactamase class A
LPKLLYMTRIAAVFAVISFLACALPSEAQDLPTPLAQLQAVLASVPAYAPGHVALEIKDLATGYTDGVNANAVMPAASTIKIPVMVEVFKQMEAGTFDLNRVVHVEASDRDYGSGDICYAPDGAGFSVSTLLTKMITVSDNTAANMLIRLVGRRNINATMSDLGLHHTKLADYIRTEEWSVRTALRTTPSDMVRLLTGMARKELIDQWSSNEMIAILERDEINSLLPMPLPPDIPIAHKTGSFDDTLNDVGIVYGNEPYVIAVMTTDLPSLESGRSFIHRISRVAYADIEQFGQWRADNGTGIQAEAGAQDASSDAQTIPDVSLWGPSPAPTP